MKALSIKIDWSIVLTNTVVILITGAVVSILNFLLPVTKGFFFNNNVEGWIIFGLVIAIVFIITVLIKEKRRLKKSIKLGTELLEKYTIVSSDLHGAMVMMTDDTYLTSEIERYMKIKSDKLKEWKAALEDEIISTAKNIESEIDKIDARIDIMIDFKNGMAFTKGRVVDFLEYTKKLRIEDEN